MVPIQRILRIAGLLLLCNYTNLCHAKTAGADPPAATAGDAKKDEAAKPKAKDNNNDENTQGVMYVNDVLPSDTTLTNIKNSHSIINKQTMQKTQ